MLVFKLYMSFPWGNGLFRNEDLCRGLGEGGEVNQWCCNQGVFNSHNYSHGMKAARSWLLISWCSLTLIMQSAPFWPEKDKWLCTWFSTYMITFYSLFSEKLLIRYSMVEKFINLNTIQKDQEYKNRYSECIMRLKSFSPRL